MSRSREIVIGKADVRYGKKKTFCQQCEKKLPPDANFWLRLLLETQMVPDEQLEVIISESSELTAILTKIISNFMSSPD